MLLKKIQHYFNRYRYHKTHRMLPELKEGGGACGQVALIAQLLGNKNNGVFVDIGANDGVRISNTYFLEQKLGWTGIAIEPIPSMFLELQKNRNCHLVNGCVTPSPGRAKFIEVVNGTDMLSTLTVNNQGLTARRLKMSAKRHGAELREIDVDCYTLEMLTNQFNVPEIDFLSLDTEGGELEILKSIDFEKTPIKTISVENNYYTDSIRNFLESKGFIYVGTFKVDEIYIYGGSLLAGTQTASWFF